MRNTAGIRGLVLALSALLACTQDPAGPAVPPTVGDLIPIRKGDTLVAQFSAGDTLVTFSFRSDATGLVALFAQARIGAASVIARDSITGVVWDSLPLATSPLPANLTASRTERITVTSGQVVHFEIRLPTGVTTGQVVVWLYPVDPRPELVASSMAPGPIVTGETLENSADVDEFTITGGAAQDINIGFLQAEAGIPADMLHMRASTLLDTPLGYETSSGGMDTDLEGQATGRFERPGSVDYRVTIEGLSIRGAGAVPIHGPYRFQVRRVTPAPDSVPALLQAGDTVEAERIDFVGDVNRFHVPVVQGRLYNVFLQARPGTGAAAFRVLYSYVGVLGAVSSAVGDSVLRGQFGGNFTALSSGVLELEVAGGSDRGGLDRGGYRLFVYPVDTLPELSPAILTPGDSVVGETIEMPGDIDRYLLTGSNDTLNLVLRRDGASPDGLDLLWMQASSWPGLECYPLSPPEVVSCPSGVFFGNPDGVPLRVLSQFRGTTGFVGPYRLVTYHVTSVPEGSPSEITPGVSVDGVLDPPGDFDRFTFAAEWDMALDLMLTGGGSTSGNSFTALVYDDEGNAIDAASGGGKRSGRFLTHSSGTYSVVVRGNNLGHVLAETGPYSLLLSTVSKQPEVVSPMLALDDSSSGESLDALGDIDDYLLQAAPGTEVVVWIYPRNIVRLEAYVPGDTARFAIGNAGTSGRLVMPPGGQLRIRVAETRQGSPINAAFFVTGPYSLVAHEVGRGTETVPPVATVGIEVSAESIDYFGDIDEYSFAGTAGQAVSLMVDDVWLASLSGADRIGRSHDRCGPDIGDTRFQEPRDLADGGTAGDA